MLNMFVLIQDLASQSTSLQSGRDRATDSWYKLDFSESKFVFAHIVHATAEVGIEPRPLAQESETLPPGHRDLRSKIMLMYMGVATSFTNQRITIQICKTDDGRRRTQ